MFEETLQGEADMIPTSKSRLGHFWAAAFLAVLRATAN